MTRLNMPVQSSIYWLESNQGLNFCLSIQFGRSFSYILPRIVKYSHHIKDDNLLNFKVVFEGQNYFCLLKYLIRRTTFITDNS